jgi:hypothetical protein
LLNQIKKETFEWPNFRGSLHYEQCREGREVATAHLAHLLCQIFRRDTKQAKEVIKTREKNKANFTPLR